MFLHLIFASALNASPAADCERLVSGAEPAFVALRDDLAPIGAAKRLRAAPEPVACEEIRFGADRVLVFSSGAAGDLASTVSSARGPAPEQAVSRRTEW